MHRFIACLLGFHFDYAHIKCTSFNFDLIIYPSCIYRWYYSVNFYQIFYACECQVFCCGKMFSVFLTLCLLWQPILRIILLTIRNKFPRKLILHFSVSVHYAILINSERTRHEKQQNRPKWIWVWAKIASQLSTIKKRVLFFLWQVSIDLTGHIGIDSTQYWPIRNSPIIICNLQKLRFHFECPNMSSNFLPMMWHCQCQ